MTRAFPNYDQRAFPIPLETTRFPSGGNTYVNPAADPYWNNVSALFGFNGANESATGDESNVSPALANVLYFGTAAVRTGESKFGGSALNLDGDSDYVRWDDHADFSPGSKDFTIEMWINRNTNTNAMFAAKFNTTVANAEWYVNVSVPNVQFVFYYGTGANSFDFLSQSFDLTINSWHHLAVDRVGHDFYMYFDGTLISSATFTDRVLQETNERMRIGARNHSTTPQFMDGWIDEYRFTLGVGRYGGVDFAPPAGPFPRF